MATERSIGSILAVDCGAVLTKAALLDRVDGAYRFVARGEALTTVEPPWRDIALGIQHAVEQVEDITGRALLDERGLLISPQQDSSTGVDAFVATSSAARSIRVVLGGLVPELSLSSAMRAVSG
ncbi:MAG TPA: methylaspartate mutase, partial [Chloroflexi bacterium]|nr:methylaspartate mutase [Chloroflexota bacterium]